MERRTDEELVAAHAAGESRAFDELVRRYAGPLFAFLARFVGQGATAEDLVQESLLQVHSSSATFDRERRFRPWIYTIAANKARDYLRSRVRRTEQSLDDGAADAEGAQPIDRISAAGPAADERLIASETSDRVRRVVGRMPEHLREILLLGYYQQMPYAEIAEVLAIPVGTVKSRLHSAVQQFSRLWEEQETAVERDSRRKRQG
ncbi:MAG: RNA polymerase sigma factor [Phycisphaerae bacterium]|nr:RNA polymerase sigma factor [Phycisphaerae bacterium]